MHTDHVSLTAQLLTTTDADAFLSGLGTMQAEVDRSNAGVQRYQLDQAKLTTLRTDAKAAEVELQKQAEAKEKLAKDYDAKEASAQAVYDRLSEEERQRLAELEARRIAAAEAAQAAAGGPLQRRSPEPRRRQRLHGQVRRRRQAGRREPCRAAAPRIAPRGPSRRAGQGRQPRCGAPPARTPSTCSGLTSWSVYRQVGVNATRSSRGRWSSVGKKVSKSEAPPRRPRVPTARSTTWVCTSATARSSTPPTPASGVNITSLNSMPFTGARRV